MKMTRSTHECAPVERFASVLTIFYNAVIYMGLTHASPHSHSHLLSVRMSRKGRFKLFKVVC